MWIVSCLAESVLCEASSLGAGLFMSGTMCGYGTTEHWTLSEQVSATPVIDSLSPNVCYDVTKPVFKWLQKTTSPKKSCNL